MKIIAPRHYNRSVNHNLITFFLFCGLFLSLVVKCLVNGDTKDSKCLRSCEVLESATQDTKPCKFPFIYNDEVYHTCTDEDDGLGKFWCSTKTTNSGQHVGGKGHWGHCRRWSYSESCKLGKDMTELMDYVDKELGVQDYCLEGPLSSDDVADYPGGKECPCKPIATCDWTHKLQHRSNQLPGRNRLRRKVINLMRESVCDYKAKNIRCCDDISIRGPEFNDSFQQKINKQHDSGQWKPDAEKDECGLDLNLSFIYCDNAENGCLAKRNEFPFMALLGYNHLDNKKILYTCGASVINKRYVLTAAHCHSDKGKIREVVVGEYVVGVDPDCDERGSCSPPIQKFGVEKVIVHDEWDSSRRGFRKGNDIALVRLDGLITLFTDDSLGSAVVPVCLPWKLNDPHIDNIEKGSKLSITGWGKITNDNRLSLKAYLDHSVASRTLRKVDLPLAVSGCRAKDMEIQFCAGGIQGFDSCSGDSGGPASYRKTPNSLWYQLGIVSYGSSKCGTKDKAGIYTRIEAYLPWIEENLEP